MDVTEAAWIGHERSNASTSPPEQSSGPGFRHHDPCSRRGADRTAFTWLARGRGEDLTVRLFVPIEDLPGSGEADVAGWIFIILRHAFLDECRRRKHTAGDGVS